MPNFDWDDPSMDRKCSDECGVHGAYCMRNGCPGVGIDLRTILELPADAPDVLVVRYVKAALDIIEDEGGIALAAKIEQEERIARYRAEQAASEKAQEEVFGPDPLKPGRNVRSIVKQPPPGEHCSGGIEITHTSLDNQGEAMVIEVTCSACLATRQFEPTTMLWCPWQPTPARVIGVTATPMRGAQVPEGKA
jgi:hypothetical protein